MSTSAFCPIMKAKIDSPPELHIKECINCPYPECIIEKREVFNLSEVDPIHKMSNGEKKKECLRRAVKAVELSKQGYSILEISQQLGYSRYTIERYLKL